MHYFSSSIATLHAHSYFLLTQIYFSTTTTTLFIQNVDNISLRFVEILLSTKNISHLGLPFLSSPLPLSQLALSLFLTSLMLWLRLQRNFVMIKCNFELILQFYSCRSIFCHAFSLSANPFEVDNISILNQVGIEMKFWFWNKATEFQMRVHL